MQFWMVWLVLRRRAKRESVSYWTGASSTCFELPCRARHGFVREQRTRDRHFRFSRLRILRACLDGFAVYIVGMVIDDFSDFPPAEDIADPRGISPYVFNNAARAGVRQGRPPFTQVLSATILLWSLKLCSRFHNMS